MKKESISVTVDAEKFRALNYYLGKRGIDLEKELENAVNKLYEKNVPAPTREYIESLCDPQAEPAARPRSRRAAQPNDDDKPREEEEINGGS